MSTKEPTPQIVTWLGRLDDVTIAEMAGVDRRTVARWRRDRGIDAAGALRVPADVVPRLGVEPDGDIAVSLGLNRTSPTVARWRTELGIPAVRKGGKGKRRKTDAERDTEIEAKYPGLLALLGVRSDRELAAEFGLAASGPRKMRRARGIPALPSKRRQP